MGLIHRDIKPANILIEAGPHPCVKITDFGLARAADDASLTQSGLLAGTPMYMAPEQAQDEALDHRTDLFSLGSVLYTMCSGRPPFRANSTLAVLKRVAEDTPRPIREIIPETPQWLCDIIARLHAKKPQDRIATAKEVADLLGRGQAAMLPSGEKRVARGEPSGEKRVATGEKLPSGEKRMARGEKLPFARRSPRATRHARRRWVAAAAVLLILLGGLGFTEATGVTEFRGTVIRLFSPEGTLVVEVDDPAVSINIDGSDIIITGAGAKEIRLKPGSYTVEARKDGKLVSRELVTVAKNGRQVVRVSQEPATAKAANTGGKGPGPKTARETTDAAAWERSVAAMPAAEQVKAVAARLKERNPGFDGQVEHKIEGGVVTELNIIRKEVTDLSPVRALVGLTSLGLAGCPVQDLAPLKGMPLTSLNFHTCTEIQDLTPLKGMPLTYLNLHDGPQVRDLEPLRGMPLTETGHGLHQGTGPFAAQGHAPHLAGP